jgi:hypothetical protein
MQKELSQDHGKTFGEKLHKPYTYLLKCLSDNTFYYGVKYSKDSDPKKFWLDYETSSKEVKKKISLYGKENFIFEIRKVFQDVRKARLWENKVLRRMKVSSRIDFMNKTENVSIPPMYGTENPMTKQEVIEKFKKSRSKNPTRKPNPKSAYDTVSKKLKGRKRPEDVCKKISNSLSGYKHNDSFKENCRKRQLNVKPSEENKKKKSESIKGRKKYTDGMKIIFRHPGTQPEGFYLFKKD